MRTRRFGQKIKLPATIAIKHQIRMRMAEYEIKKVEAEQLFSPVMLYNFRRPLR